MLYTSENATHIDTFQWNATERLILHSITLDGMISYPSCDYIIVLMKLIGSMFAEEIAVANDGM